MRKTKLTVFLLCAALLLGACSVNYDPGAQPSGITAEDTASEDTVSPDSVSADSVSADTVSPDDAVAESDTHDERKLPESDIYILFTSDVHCGVDEGIGYAGVSQIRDTLESKGYTTILVDDGDHVQGDTIGTLTKGEAIIRLMNAMKYDLAIPGNHEFDYGMEEFIKYSEIADYPYICCNLTKNGSPVFAPYVIKEAAGLKIAFVGVTTPEALTEDSPDAYKDENGEYIYGFMQGDGSEIYGAVQDAVDSARAEGADLVYLIGHLGNDPASSPYSYRDVLANTSGIDVMLDGHSHDLEQAVVKNKDGKDVPRSACGYKLNAMGYSHIKAEDGSIDTNIWKWEGSDGIPALFGIKNDISELIDSRRAELDKQLKKVVSKTDHDLIIEDPEKRDDEGNPVRIIRNRETNLGDLCADAARVRTNADIGVVNGGGVRDKIDKGDITYGSIMSVHPFNNKTVIIEVTGQQIADALEWSCRNLPDEDGGFLQVSGLAFTVDLNVKSGCEADSTGMMTGIKGDRRVSDIKVGGRPIDLSAKYTVAGNEFILTRDGNGYTCFSGAKVIANDAGLDNQLLIDYITDTLGGTVGDDYADPYGQGRIVIKD